MSEKINIGFLGLGNIGLATYELLTRRFGGGFCVTRALVRDVSLPRGSFPQGALTTDPADVLNDPSIRIVAEFLGGEEPAADYLLDALKAGKTIVTANKAALASRWTELATAAEASGAGIYFEAACCAGIPVIRALQGSLQANEITAVTGIVNGTTNYILSKMDTEAQSYQRALLSAQQLGLVEPDPTADVEGIDSANKLAILMSLASKSHVAAADIYTEGITRVTLQDIGHGRKMGYALKLLAIGGNLDGRLYARVHPAFVPLRHPLAAVGGSYNAVCITGDAAEDLMFYGKGAGPMPTASALVSDIVNAASSLAGGHRIYSIENGRARVERDWQSRYYLRLALDDSPAALAFATGIFAKAQVPITGVTQIGGGDGPTEVIVITGMAWESAINAALEALNSAMGPGGGALSVLRIEGLA